VFTLLSVDKVGNIGLQMEAPRFKPEEQEKPVFANPAPIKICV
jgi:hypothetical protein